MTNRPQRALVIGSGPDARAAARLLAIRGHRVRRADSAPADVGAHDVVVVDEWTSETEPHVRAARSAGRRLTVLAELLLEQTPRRVVAVTGTAGKTSTAWALAAILDAAGSPPLIARHGRAANAWPDASLIADAAHTGHWFVAELTSTHLCYMDGWTGPDVGVVTALWPDHVELHGSLDAYIAAKRRMLRRADRPVVLNADDTTGRGLLGPVPGDRLIEFSTRSPVAHGAWITDGAMMVRWDGVTERVGGWNARTGRMHPASAAAAAAAGLACGVPPEAIPAGLAAVRGLPHRFHRIGRIGDVELIDDGMAATPAKVLAALTRLDRRRLVVIAGGMREVRGRAVHAHPSERAALDRALALLAEVHAVVAFGDAAGVIAGATGGAVVEDLPSAVAAAARIARAGDVVLFAPMFPVPQEQRADFSRVATAALRTARGTG